MTPELALWNVGLYSAQIALLVVIAAVLPWAFGLRAPRGVLAFWYAALAVCILLPVLEPWRQITARPVGKVTVSTLAFVPGAAAGGGGLSWPFGWAATILLVVAAGAAVRFGLLALAILRLRRLGGRARPAPASASLERAIHTVRASADFLESDEVSGPVTFGWRRPVVLLPGGFFELGAAEQESIVIHELLHVARRDWVFTLAEECVRAVLWFHPAIWFLLNRVQLTREQSVDAAVVAHTRRAEEYVGALLKIAGARIQPDLAPAPLFLKKRHLRERVAAIVQGASMSKRRLILSMIAVFSVLPIAAGILAWQIPLQAAPQEVRDADGVEVQTDVFRVLHRTPVGYPEDALKKQISGNVVAAVSVNEKGTVIDAHIVSGPPELRRAVLESVLGWHFSTDPVETNSGQKPVPPSFEIAVRFTVPPAVAGGMANAQVPAAPVSGRTTYIVNRLDTTALPAALRDKVNPAINVNAADSIGLDRVEELQKSLQSIDSHLRVLSLVHGDKTDLIVMLQDRVKGSASATGDPQRIRVGGNVQATSLLQKVTPKYPPEAKAARIQGTVHLEAVIGKDGLIKKLDLISGAPELAASALESVNQWVYRPTLLNGQPVEVITQIDVNYTLAP